MEIEFTAEELEVIEIALKTLHKLHDLDDVRQMTDGAVFHSAWRKAKRGMKEEMEVRA